MPRTCSAADQSSPRRGAARRSEWVALLDTARRLRAAEWPQLDSAALTAGAVRVRERLDERRRARMRPAGRLAWAALAVLLVLAAGTAGTVLAAEGSLPGEPLYPLKRAEERARLALAWGAQPRAELRIALAERRLDELAAVCAAGDCPASLLGDLDAATQAAEEAIAGLPAGQQGSRLEEMVGLTLRQQEVLTSVLAQAPPAARPGLERALERSRRGYERARQALEKEGGSPPGAGNRPKETPTPGAPEKQHTPKDKKEKPVPRGPKKP